MSPSEQINHWCRRAESKFQNPIDWATWSSFVLDVTALKPGNVYCGSEGHGMTVGDFLQSAWITCIEICNPSYRLGQRIERSAQATLEKVGKNTNLGIILLCAPLLHACQHRTGDQTLQQSVKTNIDNADLNDAEGLNRAIRLMRPAGLGKVSEHDVWNSAQVPIRQIMESAQSRDMIARQYANNFQEIFDFGLERVQHFQHKFQHETEVATGVYMSFLSHFRDSHIVRKHGERVAVEISNTAGELLNGLLSCTRLQEFQSDLLQFDQRLKSTGINPGTSADLTVATFLASRLKNIVN